MSATSVAEAPTQDSLSWVSQLGENVDAVAVLRRIPWRRPLREGQPVGEYAGVAELGEQRHLHANAILNDMANFQVLAEVRLDPGAFAELLADPYRPTRGLRPVHPAGAVRGAGDHWIGAIGFEVMGPGPGEWRANNSRIPGYRPATHWWRFTTEGWTEVPAFVAYWFWTQQHGEDIRLGAGYFRNKTPDERDPDESRNAAVWVPALRNRMLLKYEAGESETVPADLLTIRMACEREPGERPSGLIDPTAHAAREAEIADLRAQLAALTSKRPPKGQEG